jgi:hypothetical protein
MTSRRRAPAPAVQTAYQPAPVGGVNTISPGTQLPPLDCHYAYNLIASDQGTRVRLGYQVIAEGLTGSGDNTVRSLVPFHGSHKNGSDDRLFAVTSLGIWDVSSGGTTDPNVGPNYTYTAATDNGDGTGTLVFASVAARGGIRLQDGLNDDATTFLATVLGFDGASAIVQWNDRAFSLGGGTLVDSNYAPPTPLSRSVDFPNSGGDAGYVTHHTMTTPAGKFLLLCDEVNGYYVYSESTQLWTKVATGTTAPWTANTVVQVGNHLLNGGNEYICTIAGTTAGSGGPTGTGAAIGDGTATWSYVGAAVANAVGPSLADQQAGRSLDPSNLVFVTTWNHRVFLVERDTSKAWYLDTNSIYGTASAFDFGPKMRAGGPLVGLWNWSYDGGAGMDTALVGISGAGDLVIYQGTDPTSTTTFGLKGCWSVGAVPSGRRIATDYGGDLLILSLLGAVPLSKLVIGNPSVDRTIYSTAKIAPVFTNLATLYRELNGWAVHIHPTDNALLVFVPTAEGSATTQLAMAFFNRSWWYYRDLPMLSGATFDGDFYFGTADGRVCRNYGFLDDVPREIGVAGNAIQWSLLNAFRNKGVATNKQVQMIRATFVSDEATPPYEAEAKYNMDLSELAAFNSTISGTANSWDVGRWDSMIWQAGSLGASTIGGSAGGLGKEVAISIRGNASSRTTLVGIDVYFTEGGFL